MKNKTSYSNLKCNKTNITILSICHSLDFRCHPQLYRDSLPLPKIEVARDLSILRNTQ